LKGSEVQGFKVQGSEVQGFRVQGFRGSRGLGSAPPLGVEVVRLIEKETLKKRIPACHTECIGLV